jgi:hypothetical protein
MSLHCSVICIRGSHLSKIEGLLAKLDYRLAGSPVLLSSAARATAALSEPADNESIVRKAAYEASGWTYLLDPEMVLVLENERLSTFARDHSTTILVWVCEGISGTYGFRMFAPELRREILSAGGLIESDIGDRLAEENGIEWASATEDDVLTVAKRLGAPYDYLSVDREYSIYTLDESHLPDPDISNLEGDELPFAPEGRAARVVDRVTPAKKPWWKLW